MNRLPTPIDHAPGFPLVAPARGGRAENSPLRAAIAFHAALDRFARWSPLIALLALALVARAVIEGLLA